MLIPSRHSSRSGRACQSRQHNGLKACIEHNFKFPSSDGFKNIQLEFSLRIRKLWVPGHRWSVYCWINWAGEIPIFWEIVLTSTKLMLGWYLVQQTPQHEHLNSRVFWLLFDLLRLSTNICYYLSLVICWTISLNQGGFFFCFGRYFLVLIYCI